jgi:hypothetical protein
MRAVSWIRIQVLMANPKISIYEKREPEPAPYTGYVIMKTGLAQRWEL